MYSIPAPVIKTILDYCDLPSAITFARVTKRCNTIFRHYREEILIRGEYVNVPNMFRYCSDEFIIRMSKYEFFDKNEAIKYCRRMRYKLHEKLGYGKLYWYEINKELLREIYKNGEYDNIYESDHKLQAAKLGIDLDIPYLVVRNGLKSALLTQNEKMINTLKYYGDFHTYCVTGYYHLADNYDVEHVISCINDSNNPLAAFNYIEKRGYKFEENDYYEIENYEVLKLVIPRITMIKVHDIKTKDYNALMLFYNKLIEFIKIDKFFNTIDNRNLDFTRFLLQKHIDLKNKVSLRNLWNIPLTDLADLLDNKKIMRHFRYKKDYTSMRTMIKLNGRKWAQQFNDPFIKKYYS